MLGLFVEVASSLQSSSHYLDWMADEYRTSQFRHDENAPARASLSVRVMLLAPKPVVAAWDALIAEDERFYWNQREGGDQDELGAKATQGEVQKMRDAIDRVRTAMRVALGRDAG